LDFLAGLSLLVGALAGACVIAGCSDGLEGFHRFGFGLELVGHWCCIWSSYSQVDIDDSPFGWPLSRTKRCLVSISDCIALWKEMTTRLMGDNFFRVQLLTVGSDLRA
jgi:hypothetical protein